MHPGISVIGTKFPRGHVIFDIAKHLIPFLWCIAVFHDEAAAEFHDDVERTNANWTFLHASVAGGAGPQFFDADIIVEQCFSIGNKTSICLCVFTHHFQTIAGIHHNFTWTQQFACLVGRAGTAAPATFCTTVSI